MKSEKKIDYLQYTYHEIPDWLGVVPYVGTSPLAFYRACYEFECGARVFSGNSNSDLYLIQLSGKSCERHQITENVGRLQFILDRGGKFSRIDFAVTVGGLEPLFYFNDAMRKDAVESKRFENDSPKVITDAYGRPETIYIGDLKKRGRKGVFRAYNKGLEAGLDQLLTRFELETRKKRAMVAVRRYLGGVNIGKIIRDVVDLPEEQWWVDIMGDKANSLPDYAREEILNPIERRWHWLIKQVAPALGRLIAMQELDRNSQYQQFLTVVEQSRQKYLREFTD